MEFQEIKIQHRLLTKLLFSYIFVAAIPIILVAWILMNRAQHSIQETILAQNLELAKRSAQLISTALYQAHAIIRITAQSPDIYEGNRISQELTINNLVKELPIFKKVSVIDSSGNEILSTSYLQEEQILFQPDKLQQALTGESIHSGVYLTKAYLPVMDVAVPIRYHNEVVGLLYVQINLHAMWELVEQSALGENGQAFIFDKAGKYIAHSDRREVYAKKVFEEKSIILEVQNGQENQKIYINSAKEEMLAAYTPLFLNVNPTLDLSTLSLPISDSLAANRSNQKRTFLSFMPIDANISQFSNLAWGLVIQQPTREAFAAARKLRFQIIIVGFASVLLAALLAFINTQWIISPIQKLISGIERYSRGELDFEISPLGQDEIGKLSERFNAMARKLLEFQHKLKRSERFETLSKMSSIMSHEIRNPLNSMVIYLQIMRREIRKTNINIEKFEKYLKIISNEIGRLDQLVHNFLLVSRPPKLEKKPVAIKEILNSVIMAQQANSLENGIQVESRFENENIVTALDEPKMKQVFLNIYLNAIQAMENGGKLTITLARTNGLNVAELKSEQLYACIQFIDTGKGIEPEDLKNIFEFYFSTKGEGTGLGLSIAQQIVEEHGGKIVVESHPRKGSTFKIFLPLEDDQTTDQSNTRLANL